MDDGRWVTISGRRVFIKNKQSPMDAFIKQKGGKKENFKDIEADTLKEFNQKRKEYINKNMQIDDIYKDNISRGKLKAILDNNIIGTIDYYVGENGQLEVIYVHVDENYRRLGVATKLYQQLQLKNVNSDIKFGEFTNEGEKLVNKIGKITRKEEDKEGFITNYGKIKL